MPPNHKSVTIKFRYMQGQLSHATWVACLQCTAITSWVTTGTCRGNQATLPGRKWRKSQIRFTSEWLLWISNFWKWKCTIVPWPVTFMNMFYEVIHLGVKQQVHAGAKPRYLAGNEVITAVKGFCEFQTSWNDNAQLCHSPWLSCTWFAWTLRCTIV